MRTAIVVGISLAGISAVIAIAASAQMSGGPPPNALETDRVADAEGNLHVPDSYRSTYEFLGSWAVAADQGQGSKELHIVYALPGTTAAYRNAGKFPDSTVLVKEVFHAATNDMTTGTVSHAGSLKGWFVMVKDSKGLHADNKLWGNGWGWSWFDAADPSKTTSTDYRINCLSCHVPAQASDWVYVGGYPRLKQ
jgi:hypothetical protein